MKTKAAFKKFTLMLTFVCIFTLMLICMGAMSASAAEHTDHVGYVEKTTFPTTSG